MVKPHLNLFVNEAIEDKQIAEYLARQMLHLKTRVLDVIILAAVPIFIILDYLYERAKRFLIRALQMQKAEGQRQEVSKTLQTLASLHRREHSSFVLEKAC